MGCRQLNIYDYFRLIDTEKNEKLDMRFWSGIRKNVYRDFCKSTHGTMTQLNTYRDGLTPDATTWNYDTATGLLVSKTDAAGKATTYTYDNANRLSSRIWARLDNTNPLSTTYSYSPMTGELITVNYSDGTPSISYTYNRLGQQATVTDAVGTRTFAYNNALQLTSESINGLYSKVITRSYETTGMIGRYKGINIGTEYDVDYGYDAMGRFSTVTNGSDTYTYGYLANSNLVSTITYPNTISVTNSYESNRNLITSVDNKYGATTISKYQYVNDALGRRTSMAKSGTAFTATDTINYGYDDKSQVISADAVNDANYDFGFDYDTIGNRTSYDTTESGSAETTTYTTNNLNQYTSLTSLPSVQNPSYNDDGCMLTNGNWTYTWNAENRMVSAVDGTTTLEFKYDYMGRRVEKKVIENGTTTKKEYFVYDGYKQIEKLDVLNSNAIAQKFVWQGEKILSVTSGTNIYYYTHDANKNVSELLDSSGNTVAHYEYSPFGKVTVNNGSYASDNPYRFSSEYADNESGLVYYNYRFYDAKMGRWLNRDPITEIGSSYPIIQDRQEAFKDAIFIYKKIIKYLKMRVRVSLEGNRLDNYVLYQARLSLMKELLEDKKQLLILGKTINPYCYLNNNSINMSDFLGLDESTGAACKWTLDQFLDALDTATKGTANKVIKIIKLLRKLKDGLKDLTDPAKKKEAEKIIKQYERLIKHYTDTDCLLACHRLLAYFNQQCGERIVCGNACKEIHNAL